MDEEDEEEIFEFWDCLGWFIVIFYMGMDKSLWIDIVG